MTTTPSTEQSAAPPKRGGFFNWIRGTEIVRERGWLGGVSYGLAQRAGIDPLIVRGMFVVLTIVGFPAILLYAILWALLPDENGKILLQELFHGRVSPPMLGILLTIGFSLVPVNNLLWRLVEIITSPYGMVTYSEGMVYDFDYEFAVPGFGALSNSSSLFYAVVGVALALIVAAILIALARRNNGPAPLGPRPANGSTAAADASLAATADSGDTAASTSPTSTNVEAVSFTPVADIGDVAGATDLDPYLKWHQQHASTKNEHEAYRAQLVGDVGAHRQAGAEAESAARNFAAERAAHRRARALANPRASLAYHLGVIGFGVLVAAIVTLIRAQTVGTMGRLLPEAIAYGAFAGAFIVAAGMVTAGLLRRRSGFLTFATVFALVVGCGGLFLSRTDDVVWDGGYVDLATAAGSTIYQPYGYLFVDAWSQRENAQPAVIEKGEGFTAITIGPNTALNLTVEMSPDAEAPAVCHTNSNGACTRVDMKVTSRDDDSVTYKKLLTSDQESDLADLTTYDLVLRQDTGTVWIDISSAGVY